MSSGDGRSRERERARNPRGTDANALRVRVSAHERRGGKCGLLSHLSPLDEAARGPFIVQKDYLGNLLRDSERKGGQVVAEKGD